MTPRKYSSIGIVIKRRNFSEADRIIVLYTKDYGKITLLAKGVRKPKSRKRGHVEMFTLINFSASRTKSLDLITEVETVEVFDYEKDIKRVSVAYFIVETIDKLTREGENNEELYSHIIKNMKILRNVSGLKEFRLEFVRNTLIILGYWPEEKPMSDPDSTLEEVVEKRMNSVRVGKKISK
ncbi:DNA repair protein RecO [Patescibacteria group bacterium]